VGSTRRFAWLMFCAAVVCASSARVWAQDQPPPASPEEESRTLVLGIARNSRVNGAARDIVVQRLLRLGRITDLKEVIYPRGNYDKEASKLKLKWDSTLETCQYEDKESIQGKNSACLSWIAKREKASQVLGGDIQEEKVGEKISNFSVRLWLYDAKHQKVIEDLQHGCEECDEKGMIATLRTVTGLLFDSSGTPPENIHRDPPCPRIECPKPPSSPLPGVSRGLSPTRKGVAAVFGTITFLALGTALVLSGIEGKDCTLSNCPKDNRGMPTHVYDTGKYTAIPLIVGAGSLVGLIIPLALP